LVRDNQPELKLMRDWLDLVGPGAHRRRVRLSNFEGQEDVGKEIEGTQASTVGGNINDSADGLDSIRWKRRGDLRASYGASHLRTLGGGLVSLGNAESGRAGAGCGLWDGRRGALRSALRGPERVSSGP